VLLVDSQAQSETLDVLGRCSRAESCEASNRSTGGLTRMLHLINGPLLNRRIAAPDNHLSRLISDGATSDNIVAEFYRLAFSREPSQREREHWRNTLGNSIDENKRAMLEDFLWGLLNSHEFTTNH
jgi:hypothetical protein